MTKTETACNSKRVASCFVIETDVFLLSLFIAYAIHPVYSLCILLSLSDLC